MATPPTSVGFMARAAPCKVDAALAKNLPHRSRENEFTDGRVGRFLRQEGRRVLYELNGFGRVQTSFQTTLTGDELAQRERPKTCELSRPAGIPPRPFTPFGGTPYGLETSQDFCRNGRANRDGLSSKYSETRPRSLDPP